MTARVMFRGEVFEHSGEGSWHFVKVPADVVQVELEIVEGDEGDS